MLGAVAAAVVATIVLGHAWPDGAGAIDFFLMVVVYYAITRPRLNGIWMGAVCGLIQDALGSHYLGYQAFVKTGVAYLVGGLGSKFILNQPFPQFLALLLATVLDAVLASVLSAMVGLPAPYGPAHLAKAVLLNPVLGLMVFRLVGRRHPAGGSAHNRAR